MSSIEYGFPNSSSSVPGKSATHEPRAIQPVITVTATHIPTVPPGTR